MEGVEKSEEVSEPMEDVGERARWGGGVEAMDLRSGSKGELDGEAKGGACLGKVKAGGVGERMATVGVSGSSVVVITSSAAGSNGDNGERQVSGPDGGRGRELTS